MSWNNGCGCGNPWQSSTRAVCGEFVEPTVPDEGRCSPYRVKTDCEAPTIPVAQCEDDQYAVIYQPENEDNPFAISARLFDSCCEAITDESGNPITIIITQTSGAASGTCPA
jgi:hypothetical protein